MVENFEKILKTPGNYALNYQDGDIDYPYLSAFKEIIFSSFSEEEVEELIKKIILRNANDINTYLIFTLLGLKDDLVTLKKAASKYESRLKFYHYQEFLKNFNLIKDDPIIILAKAYIDDDQETFKNKLKEINNFKKGIVTLSVNFLDEIPDTILNYLMNTPYIEYMDSISETLIKKLDKESLMLLTKKYYGEFKSFVDSLEPIDKVNYLNKMSESEINRLFFNFRVYDFSSDEKEIIFNKTITYLLKSNVSTSLGDTLTKYLYDTEDFKYVMPFLSLNREEFDGKTSIYQVIKEYNFHYGRSSFKKEELDKLIGYEVSYNKDEEDNYTIVLKINFLPTSTYVRKINSDPFKHLDEMNEFVPSEFFNQSFFSYKEVASFYNESELGEIRDNINKVIEQIKEDISLSATKKVELDFKKDSSTLYNQSIFKITSDIKNKYKCDLIPNFTLDNSVSFKITNYKKEYLIKNLKDFVFAFTSGNEIKFSKDFTFFPHYNNLNYHGQKVYDVITYSYYKDEESIILNEGILSLLLNAYKKDDYILINNSFYSYGGEIEYLTLEVEKDTTLRIKSLVDFNGYIAFNNLALIYSTSEKVAYKVSGRKCEIIPFFIKYNHINLHEFNFEEIFFNEVYRYFKDEINFAYEDTSLIKDKINLYFDLRNDVLSYDIKIKDETGEHDGNLSENKNILLIKDYLTSLGFVSRKLSSQDEVYNFLSMDLTSLKGLCDIYFSDAIKKIEVKKLPKIKYTITYNNNLMNVALKESEFSTADLNLIYDYIKRKKKYVKLSDGTVLKLDNEDAREFFEITNSLSLDPTDLTREVELPLYKRFKINNSTDYPLEKYMEEVVSEISTFKDHPIDLPTFPYELKGYQKDAIYWLNLLKKYHFSGILADDMGLGKTFEMLAFYSLDKTNEPSLIVCPKSLIFNWSHEINKFIPDTKFVKVYGSLDERKKIISSISPNERCLYITSYDSLRNDIDLYKECKFRYLILDEAQAIKTNSAKKTLSVKKINSTFRFVLTGTPIENNILELWSIFDFLMPGYFEDISKFKSNFEKDPDYKSFIYKKIALFVLRRTKKEMLKELPDKYERIITCELSEEQRKVYDSYRIIAKEKLTQEGVFNALPYILRLRQICIDPNLFMENYEGEASKLALLSSILDEYLPNGRKILIFSQFVELLNRIGSSLDSKNIPYYMLTGATKVEERVTMCDEFNDANNNVQIFLISIKAGGSGLNLIGADTVIHMDIWWNLALENQATDRSYRLGQNKNVEVIKLIAENTIEENILELQNKKKDLIDSLISNDDSSITNMSKEDIKFILGD